MRGLSQSVWAHEDQLVSIYRRTGDAQFTHSEIADLLPRGAMLRYTTPGIFLPARDPNGIPIKGGSRDRSQVWRWHPYVAELCRRAIERDHRWENLAAGLTGGQYVHEDHRPPLILTTGRWLCSKCLQRIPIGAESCPQCGGKSFKIEYDQAALAEADRRAAARGSHHDMG